MSKRNKIFFGLILGIAIILRFWSFGTVPPSPDWDEVALGYNAYSILETGKDEYGKFLPVVLQSFDDYKPALYAYLVIPFIKLFGLTVVAVRFPSALFGVLTVFATFFLIKELLSIHTKGEKREQNLKKSEGFNIQNWKTEIALLTSFFLSISPWHIQFSRIGFEANVALAFNIFALLFFLKGLRNGKYYIPSFLSAVLGIYVYQSEKVFVPLLFLALFIIFFKRILSQKKTVIVALVIAFVAALPMFIYIVTNPNALTRAKGVSVFSNQTKFLQSNVEKLKVDSKNNDTFGLIVDNRRIEYVRGFLVGYLAHYELNWLFYSGDIPRHHAPFMGQLYLVELPFLLLGIYLLIFGNISRKAKFVIFSYYLLAPIPASITIDVPHAVRTLNVLPMYQFFTAVGVLYGIYTLRKINIVPVRYAICIIILALFSLNFLYYLNQYFVQMNYYFSKDWQYGYKELVEYVKPQISQFDNIIVTNQPPLDQSYMFFLYYLKYDPAKYLSEGGTKSGNFAATHTSFGNFIFRPIQWDQDRNIKNSLFIGRPDDLPVNIDKTIYYLNGEEAIETSRTPK